MVNFQRVRPYLSRFAVGFAVGFPMAVTFVENVGSIKGVNGISMQVSSSFVFSVEFMQRWSIGDSFKS